MASPFLTALESRIVIGDGAMGTYIYTKGIPLGRCYDELNLTNPHLIRKIHKEYVEAGAELIETNTFSANRYRLKRYELHEKVREINLKGAQIAREGGGKNVFVAGSVGPLTGAKRNEELTKQDAQDIYTEQIEALAEGGCDVIILETFTDLDELKLALKIVKDRAKLPAICQMTFSEKSKTPLGVSAATAVRELELSGADVFGANCGVGPLWTLRVIEQLTSLSKIKISAFPNAGLPEYHDGRYMYLSTPDYIASTAKKMVNAGANLVGGCCGTTPADIRAMATLLKNARPMPRRIVKLPVIEVAEAVKIEKAPPKKDFLSRLKERVVITAELDPPKGLEYQKVISGAKKLFEAGIDAITVGDNPLAVLRMGNVGVAHLMEREGIPTIAHVSCRDKNLIGLQSAIMEAHALGITSLLAITGDPAKVGDQPGASSVYDLNSFDLIKLVRSMNEGKNYAGNSIGGTTRFSVACAFNPNVKDVDIQIRRLQKKIAAGAQYALSQPLYDINRVAEIYGKLKQAIGDFPVFLGVLPLVSASNAEFLNSEVPGIQIPEPVIRRMHEAPPDRAREEGLKISCEIIDRALEFTRGIYIIPPFGSVTACLRIAEHIRSRENKLRQL